MMLRKEQFISLVMSLMMLSWWCNIPKSKKSKQPCNHSGSACTCQALTAPHTEMMNARKTGCQTRHACYQHQNQEKVCCSIACNKTLSIQFNHCSR
jgi:hypothetical protein